MVIVGKEVARVTHEVGVLLLVASGTPRIGEAVAAVYPSVRFYGFRGDEYDNDGHVNDTLPVSTTRLHRYTRNEPRHPGEERGRRARRAGSLENVTCVRVTMKSSRVKSV